MALKVYVTVSVAASLSNDQYSSENVRVVQKNPTDSLKQIWELEVIVDTTNPYALLSSEMNGAFSEFRLPDVIASDGGVDLLNESGQLAVPRIVLNKFCNVRVLAKKDNLVQVLTSKGKGWVQSELLGFDDSPNLPFRITRQDGTLLKKCSNEKEAKHEAGKLAKMCNEKVHIHHINNPGQWIGVDPF